MTTTLAGPSVPQFVKSSSPPEVPALRSGASALGPLLDQLCDAVACFGPDGQLRHANRAMRDRLAADAEAARLEADVWQCAWLAVERVRSGAAGERAMVLEREVATRDAVYTVRAVPLPPEPGCDLGRGVAVLLQVARAAPLGECQLRARYGLSPQQARVVRLLAEGRSNEEIAQTLFISVHTARHHTQSVLTKMNVHSRAAVPARLLGG